MQRFHTLYLKSLLLLLFLLTSFATIKAGANNNEKALLWEISGKGLKQPSYIFGTIHAICQDEFTMPEAVKARLQQTEQLSLEVDMDAPSFMTEMQQSLILQNGGSLKSFFTEEEYKTLSEYFASNLGIPLQQVDMLKPLTLYSMLLSQLTDCQTVMLEQQLMEMAHAQGKEIIGVETVKEQIAAMEQIPVQIQVNMLMETVREMDKAKADYREMVALYLNKDVQGLFEVSRKDFTAEEYKAYEEAFLTSRNKRWIPVIEREVKSRPTFFAVGTGHLAGQNGLLELLRKQGYTIKPVLE
ncbi:TraB/GumN family protein [Pontibacter silvestris]|uniref:TraB/GumN family protein n=1 Tax=Pontibacter silvestris TaxID=2305183 RepID=A0ABW4X3P2_9BACT|nr:TraB/GumN family protein [Pontibacter silvestris]MCC9137057.1 TraB/GumN family protein [Pontibacter silvestris]